MYSSSASSSSSDLSASLDSPEHREVKVRIEIPEEKLTTKEGIEAAIEDIREKILQSEAMSYERRALVDTLVKLKMRLIACFFEEPLPKEHRMKKGHRLVPYRHFSRRRQFCDHCVHLLWPIGFHWYKCQSCSLNVHGDCVNRLRRPCPKEKLKNNEGYITDICPESAHGLADQDYACKECKTVFILGENQEMSSRLCDYDGQFYCGNCHWMDEMIIPSRVVHNWDFCSRPVSRWAYQYLTMMLSKPCINLERINKQLFIMCDELVLTKKYREEIMTMKAYLTSCREAGRSKLLLLLTPRQHFVETSYMYSMKDVIDVKEGLVVPFLEDVCSKFRDHITKQCTACKGKGHICQMCYADEVLYPFDSHTSVCPQCYTGFHRECYQMKKGKCPRCERRKARALQASDDSIKLAPDSPPHEPFLKF